MLKVNIPKHTYTIIKNIGCPNGIIEDRKGYYYFVLFILINYFKNFIVLYNFVWQLL